MAIYFSNTLSKEPFQFDSVGNHWLQEALSRPQGYPIYHYLQTEEGCGIFTIDGKEYFLPEGHGILITPHVHMLTVQQTPLHGLRVLQHLAVQWKHICHRFLATTA